MTAADQPAEARRESFLDVAQREMIPFENREREFRKRSKQKSLPNLHCLSLRSNCTDRRDRKRDGALTGIRQHLSGELFRVHRYVNVAVHVMMLEMRKQLFEMVGFR